VSNFNDGQGDYERRLAGKSASLGKVGALAGLVVLGLLIWGLVALFGGHGAGAPADPASSAPAALSIVATSAEPLAAPAIPAQAQDAVSSAGPPNVAGPQPGQASPGPKKPPADLEGLY